MKQSVKYLKIFANLLVAVLGIFVVFFVFPKLLIFFMPFVIGYVISMIANPLVRFLEKHLKLLRKHGSIIIIVGVLALVILILYLIFAKLVGETILFLENAPQMYESLSAKFDVIGENFAGIIKQLPESVRDAVSDVTSNLSSYVGNLVEKLSGPTFIAAGNFAKNVPGTLIAIIMSILSAYFFTVERDKITAYLKKHMPKGVMERVLYGIQDLKHVVWGYFKAQFKIMGVVYIILVIGLLILRVNHVLLVALIIAFLDMLPFLGTGTVLGPWAVIEILTADYKMAIALIILYCVTQLVRQLIQPKLVGDSIGMDPLVTLIFMYIGFKFSGVIGMIIAVPVGMIVINLFRAGVFDNQVRCVKELVHDFNQFRKL